MSYCATCSIEYDDSKRFCKICGNRLESNKQAIKIPQEIHNDGVSYPETKPSRIYNTPINCGYDPNLTHICKSKDAEEPPVRTPASPDKLTEGDVQKPYTVEMQ